jgi:hypothetical protein
LEAWEVKVNESLQMTRRVYDKQVLRQRRHVEREVTNLLCYLGGGSGLNSTKSLMIVIETYHKEMDVMFHQCLKRVDGVYQQFLVVVRRVLSRQYSFPRTMSYQRMQLCLRLELMTELMDLLPRWGHECRMAVKSMSASMNGVRDRFIPELYEALWEMLSQCHGQSGVQLMAAGKRSKWWEFVEVKKRMCGELVLPQCVRVRPYGLKMESVRVDVEWFLGKNVDFRRHLSVDPYDLILTT